MALAFLHYTLKEKTKTQGIAKIRCEATRGMNSIIQTTA